MGQIEKAISYSKKIESLLENKLGAQGRGLHEKVSSVETQLPRDIVRNIRFIATLRNKLVHEEGFRIDDMKNFAAKSKMIITALRKVRGASFKRRVLPLKAKGGLKLLRNLAIIILCGALIAAVVKAIIYFI